MSAKDRIRRIAIAAARGESGQAQPMYQTRSEATPTQGIVESVIDTKVTVRLLNGEIVTVNITNRQLLAGDLCVVYGGRAQ
jgi:hypothetical protein